MKRINLLGKEFMLLSEKDMKEMNNYVIGIEQGLDTMAMYVKKTKKWIGNEPSPVLKVIKEGLDGIERSMQHSAVHVLQLDPGYQSAFDQIFKGL